MVLSGELAPASIPTGDAAQVGTINLPLNDLKAPARYDLELLVRGTPFRNQWPIWVFDRAIDTQPPPGVTVARKLDLAAQQRLSEGETVLLLPSTEDLQANTQMAGRFVDGQFQSDFWSYSMFQRIATNLEMKPSPDTLGLLMNPEHPALAQFPTETHTDWQWWHLVKGGRAVVLDGAPAGYRPIVQVIDNVNRNQLLRGRKRLMVVADRAFERLLKEHPEMKSLQDELHFVRHEWQHRNEAMADNIVAWARQYRSKRIVVVVGVEHRHFLRDRTGLALKEYWQLQ